VLTQIGSVCLLTVAVITAPALASNANPSFLVQAEADTLAPGDFLWKPSAASGSLSVVVDLSSQHAFVYRGGTLIAISTVSSGKPGHETPTGTFTVLEKQKMHHSNKYDDAPMPYMQRLGWDGLALHGGHPHGYPASHGCVRLPMGFAAELFKESTRGMQVVITGEAPSRAEIMAARADPASRCCAASGSAGTGSLQATKFLKTQDDRDATEAQCCARAPGTASVMPSARAECEAAVEGGNGSSDDGDTAGAPERLPTECSSNAGQPPGEPDYSSNPGR
jgi:hypothetical protein